jgi:predicted TIM-barrel fold metal-dependent hydrolase
MTDRWPDPHRIDVHAHYLAPAYREALQEAEMALIGDIPVPEWTPGLALEFMDAHGIAVQMLSVSDPGVEFVDPERAPALAGECNDYAAGVVHEHPGRFGAFAARSWGCPPAAPCSRPTAPTTRSRDPSMTRR